MQVRIPTDATGQPHASQMNENEDREQPGSGWGNLVVQDHGTEEERKVAEAKESARRRGRKTQDWWKKYLPPEQGG